MELPPAHLILTRPSRTSHRTTRVLAESPRCEWTTPWGSPSGREWAALLLPLLWTSKERWRLLSVHQEQELCRSFLFSLSFPIPLSFLTHLKGGLELTV